jgi:hypothetical protein
MDDFSSITVGDYGAAFAPQFLHAIDQSPVNLAGCTISMVMRLVDGGPLITCIGAWTIDNAATGQTHYQYHIHDLDNAGLYKMSIEITNSNGPVHADVKILEILAPI